MKKMRHPVRALTRVRVRECQGLPRRLRIDTG
jgi:hypothetical protein